MLTPIGEMREPVLLLTRQRTTDEAGGEVLAYSESDPIFVAIRATNTLEQTQFNQVNADVSHLCFGHFQDLNGVASTTRIRELETGTEYDIAGLPINDPNKAWTKLMLVLRDNA